MAKFSGVIGFVETVEVEPGIWEPTIIERVYRGDLIQNTRRYQNSGEVNDDINISNKISIVADPYANTNVGTMRYVGFMGVKWKVTDIDIQPPRLILSIGGVWNGESN